MSIYHISKSASINLLNSGKELPEVAGGYPWEEGLEVIAVLVDCYVRDIEFMKYEVLSGPHTGLVFRGALGLPSLLYVEGNSVEVPSASAGWNTSWTAYRVGKDVPKEKWPSPKSKTFQLKPGETLADFPELAPREVQLSWLEERLVKWYPYQEMGIIKYLSPETLQGASTLDEFCMLARISSWELEFKEEVSDPGAEYRRVGLSLDMSEEAFLSRGNSVYRGFIPSMVRKALEQPRLLLEVWTSPEIWVKYSKTIRGRESTVKEKRRFLLTREINLTSGGVKFYITMAK